METEISPVFHAGGKGVYAGSDSTNSETCLDDWVGMEKHSLDHIQNICVSVQIGLFMLKSTHTKQDFGIQLLFYLLEWNHQYYIFSNCCIFGMKSFICT